MSTVFVVEIGPSPDHSRILFILCVSGHFAFALASFDVGSFQINILDFVQHQDMD